MADKTTRSSKKTAKPNKQSARRDAPHLDATSLWDAISKTPGVGMSITDGEGNLLFVNDTSKVIFSESTQVETAGKKISDFHPPEYVKERLQIINRVLSEARPLQITHIYHGRRISSTIWPIRDRKPPCDRVIVVSREQHETGALLSELSKTCETVTTSYIDLGPLNVLTKRELEVMVLLGHGMSVPAAAAALHRSPKTVQRHKASISRKLNLHGQAELVAVVTAMGLELPDTKLARYQ